MAEKKPKPISKRTAEIVGNMAKARTVEELVMKISRHSTMNQDLADLSQFVYLVLLQMETKQLEKLIETRELTFYMISVIRRQYYSKKSHFYREIRRLRELSSEISQQFADSFSGKTWEKI